MATIGAFEAKTHFSQLLARVAKGETILITKHGEAIAKLVPVKSEKKPSNPAAEAAQAIRKNRKGVTLGKLNLKQLISQGRK